MYMFKMFLYKNVVVYICILLFIHILITQYFNKSKEGFNASDITNIASKVGNIAESAKNLPGKIVELGTTLAKKVVALEQKVEGKIVKIEEKIEGKIVKISEKIEGKIGKIEEKIAGKIAKIQEKIAGLPKLIIQKIKDFAKNLGKSLNTGIIQPFKLLFVALGNVFVQVFKILKKIGKKIKSLPGCSVLYMFQSVFGTIHAIYKLIVPGFLENFFKLIYKYTLKIPVEYLSKWTGLDAWWDKCFNFDVDDEVDNIKAGFAKAQKSFNDDFGRMDFKNLI